MSNEKFDILRPRPEVRIFKEIEEDNGKVKTAKKILVHVLYWTEFPGEKLEFNALFNDKKKVTLQIKQVKTQRIRRFRQLVPITFIRSFEDGVDKKKFIFDSDKNCDFLVHIDEEFQNTRPESTKKKVVTYEDTDIIDDTELPK
jgi:hypothetical protein